MSVLLVAAAVAAVTACHGKKRKWTEEEGEVQQAWKPDSSPAANGVSLDAIRTAIGAKLAAAAPESVRPADWRSVRGLYRSYQSLPLWFTNGKLHDRTRSLVSELAKAPTHGLRLRDFPIASLNQALQSFQSASTATPEQIADIDVLLSATYVALAHDLLTGQIEPRSLSQDWHIDPHKVDVDSALATRLRLEPLDRAIAQLRPADPDYDALREQLEHYRELARGNAWPRVPDGRALKPRDTEARPRLEALVQRLQGEGFLASGVALQAPSTSTANDSSHALYDDNIAGAIAAFQAHHGIVVDSILGSETVASLNVPISYRLGQIVANLERFRWLPRDFGSRYILVNVPAFRLQAFDSAQTPLEMKVIVGAEYENRNTPVFSDSMQYVVFRPYWLVPDAIAAKETWPKAEADPGYLERNNYEVYDDHGAQRVRQRPGGKNSLGLAKFMFPNDFNIYLHDTPQGELFAKDVRAFSHGCIRIEKPAELAQWVLGWPADRVLAAMESGPENKTVNLPRKIPVYIVYFTTYMRDDQLYFGNDLYDRDNALVKQLMDASTPSADELRSLAELTRLTSG